LLNNWEMAATRPPLDPDLSYTDLDRGDATQAHEQDTDSAWARFEALSSDVEFNPTAPMSIPAPLSEKDRAYAPTVPAALDKHPASPLAPAAKRITVTEAMDEARRNRRVCPGQQAWLQLYEMLPNKRQSVARWDPAPPITGPAWDLTPSISKRMCLRDHIEWADKERCLNEVFAFLKSLPEEAWHHSE
jgi:hypothetical protein